MSKDELTWTDPRIMTGENQSTATETCPSATFSTTNATQSGLGLNPGLHGERPAIKFLSHVVNIIEI